jgi:hypothetical protein
MNHILRILYISSTLCSNYSLYGLTMKFQSEHYFHLGYNSNEPIILVFEMLRISIVVLEVFMSRTSYVCL